MIHDRPLPVGIETRIATLGRALEARPHVIFAYLFGSAARDDYRRDWKVQRIVERTLQMAIEVCADVATRVIADRGLRVPATYAEAFEVLAEAGLLDPALAATMVGMARFRNVIVHDYTRVDPDVVIRILRAHLADFARFRTAALAW